VTSSRTRPHHGAGRTAEADEIAQRGDVPGVTAASYVNRRDLPPLVVGAQAIKPAA